MPRGAGPGGMGAYGGHRGNPCASSGDPLSSPIATTGSLPGRRVVPQWALERGRGWDAPARFCIGVATAHPLDADLQAPGADARLRGQVIRDRRHDGGRDARDVGAVKDDDVHDHTEVVRVQVNLDPGPAPSRVGLPQQQAADLPWQPARRRPRDTGTTQRGGPGDGG